MMKTKQRGEMSERESPTEINLGRQPINYFAADDTLLAPPFRYLGQGSSIANGASKSADVTWF